VIASTLVASESCRIVPSNHSVHLRTQQHGNAEKSRLGDGKRVDFIRYWQRSGQTKDFYKEQC